MVAVAVLLLVGGVAGALARPWHAPAWGGPVAAAAVALAVGVVDLDGVLDAVEPLAEPVAFLVLAVPLAVLLDGAGVFDAAARRVAGRRVCAGLWVLGAVAVAVLNLDAAVVLLTPLYVRIARRWSIDPLALAFQPALLACLASSALPVSNLTNLIAASERGLDSSAFLGALGLPTVAACAVGYGGWRLAFRGRDLVPGVSADEPPAERRALAIGGVVLVALVVGFVPGRALGIPAWAVVAVVDAALLVFVAARRRALVALRAVPVGTVLVAVGLAVLAAGAAARLDVGAVLGDGDGAPATLRVVGVAALGANLANNLPAFLVALPAAADGAPLWGLLLGVNVGPTVVVTGSLSGLLWLDVARRSGLTVGARQYARVGLIAGVPALAAATGVLLLTT